MEAFQQLIVDVKRHHETSRDRFRMVRMKHYLEFTRQKEFLDNIRKRFWVFICNSCELYHHLIITFPYRLLSAVRARRYALDLPSTAKSSIEFCQLTEQAEEALRVLKVINPKPVLNPLNKCSQRIAQGGDIRLQRATRSRRGQVAHPVQVAIEFSFSAPNIHSIYLFKS